MLSSLAGPPSSLRPACGRVRVRASASLQKEHKLVSILHKCLDFPFANMKSLGCILVSAPAAGALFSCPYEIVVLNHRTSSRIMPLVSAVLSRARTHTHTHTHECLCLGLSVSTFQSDTFLLCPSIPRSPLSSLFPPSLPPFLCPSLSSSLPPFLPSSLPPFLPPSLPSSLPPSPF